MNRIKCFFQSNIIHKSFKHGKNFKIGRFCRIEEDVVVGDDVTMSDFVLLRKGTAIGNGTFIDAYVKSSGTNYIGNNVTLRFNTTVAKNVTIEDEAFLSPNVMTIFTTHEGKQSSGTTIGRKAFIGTNAVIGPNINIGPDVVIGALAYVSKDCTEPGIYVGVPAKKLIKESESRSD